MPVFTRIIRVGWAADPRCGVWAAPQGLRMSSPDRPWLTETTMPERPIQELEYSLPPELDYLDALKWVCAKLLRLEAEALKHFSYNEFDETGELTAAHERIIRHVQAFIASLRNLPHPNGETVHECQTIIDELIRVLEHSLTAIQSGDFTDSRLTLLSVPHRKLRELLAKLELHKEFQYHIERSKPPARPLNCSVLGLALYPLQRLQLSPDSSTNSIREQSAPNPPAAENNNRVAKTSEEAVAILKDEWATYAALSRITGLTESAIRASFKRAKDKNVFHPTDEEPIRERRKGVARKRFRIRGVWKHLSLARERSNVLDHS